MILGDGSPPIFPIKNFPRVKGGCGWHGFLRNTRWARRKSRRSNGVLPAVRPTGYRCARSKKNLDGSGQMLEDMQRHPAFGFCPKELETTKHRLIRMWIHPVRETTIGPGRKVLIFGCFLLLCFQSTSSHAKRTEKKQQESIIEESKRTTKSERKIVKNKF